MRIYLEVDGQQFDQWSELTVVLRLNTVASTFSFTGDRTEANEHLFRPGVMHECIVWLDKDNGDREKLITGYICGKGLSSQRVKALETVSGYSRPGILNDGNMPKGLYPLQYNQANLREIAARICRYYDLELYVHPGAQADAEKRYEEVDCKPTEKIKDFLSRIAKDRGITVAHDNLGRLMLYKIVNITPARSQINEKRDPTLKISMSPTEQRLHNTCLAITDSEATDLSTGENSEVGAVEDAVVRSPFLKTDLKRNTTVVLKNIEATRENLYALAEAELAREARAFPIICSKEGWDFRNRIVRAGFYLKVEAESIFYKETKTVVETMTFTKKPKSPPMLEFTCVLPCVYTGKLPKESPFLDKSIKPNIKKI